MKRRILAALVVFACAGTAGAQVSVKDPWVRATTAQQKATGAFMKLESQEDARLVEARSPLAGVVELHEMAMEKDVAKMRAVSAIAIRAGKGVELRPGGYHMMLMELKAQLKEGDIVPISLVIEDKDGKRRTLEVKAPVRPLKAAARDAHKH